MRVCVPRDSQRTAAARDECSAHGEQVGFTNAGGRHRLERDRGTVEALRVAQDPGIASHHPLELVADRDPGTDVVRRDSPACRGRRGRADAPELLGTRSFPRDDRIDRSCCEDESLEQRVRRQSVGAVHAGARGFPARPQPGQRAGTVEIGDDTARQVVRSGRDGEPLTGRVETDRRAGTEDRGEAVGEVGG